jgi:hypothetical protein
MSLASSGVSQFSRMPFAVLTIPFSFGLSSVSVLMMSWQRRVISVPDKLAIVFVLSLGSMRVTSQGSRCFLRRCLRASAVVVVAVVDWFVAICTHVSQGGPS